MLLAVFEMLSNDAEITPETPNYTPVVLKLCSQNDVVTVHTDYTRGGHRREHRRGHRGGHRREHRRGRRVDTGVSIGVVTGVGTGVSIGVAEGWAQA